MTLAKKTLLFILVLCALSACHTPIPEKNPSLKCGVYELLFDIGEVWVPVRLSISKENNWCIHNWSENIAIDSLSVVGSTFHVKLPLFNTTLDGTILTDSTFSGIWTDYSRDTLYTIPFTAMKSDQCMEKYFGKTGQESSKKIYDVVFSPDSDEDRTHAVGVFYTEQKALVGTFLTESGDYRFLEGTSTGQSMHLSSFDGAHLFYFCANIDGDQLTDGRFYSGKHWMEDWTGTLNPTASLRDPDSLTFLQNKKNPFYFTVLDSLGDSVLFDKKKFMGHVSIIQIFGSWCPNCTDESRYMKELYDAYHEDGLEIIPVAFERAKQFEAARDQVVNQFNELGLQYSPYFGGQSDKNNASRVFAQLSKITSYPTIIIIDKNGEVRKIHTGFYGPGTGEHFKKHSIELQDFIVQLLGEKS